MNTASPYSSQTYKTLTIHFGPVGPKAEAIHTVEKYPGLNWVVLGIAKFLKTCTLLDNRGDMRWTKDGGVNKTVKSYHILNYKSPVEV